MKAVEIKLKFAARRVKVCHPKTECLKREWKEIFMSCSHPRNLLLREELLHQFIVPLSAGVHTSQVVQDFSHQQ